MTVGFDRSRRILAALAALLALATIGAAEGGDAGERALEEWLGQQARVESWSADVLQRRSLRSLVKPLEARGRVWFAQPNRFRWQLGDPPRTIAVRTEAELLVIYPRLEQVERYRLSDAVDPAWRQALALLEVGFPGDADDFRSRYELLEAIEIDGGWRFVLRPFAAEARRLIDELRLEVAADAATLLATELSFPDGSSMRNEFSGHRLNPELDHGLFEFEVEEGWETVNPLER